MSPASLARGRSISSRRIAAALAISFTALAGWVLFHAASAKAAPAANHGLAGFYYASDVPLDEFQIPLPGGNPTATRIDQQVAFGQGKGFHDPKPEQSAQWAIQPGLTPGRVGWLKAVLWRGFIHLPKAGTYYLATVSDGASAIYLNQARVALNGMQSHYGVLLNSDTFAYDQADVQDFIQDVKGSPFATRRQDAYVVPIAVEGPRDLPIEVRYSALRSERTAGIDLLWVTPDSPKNANGKPLAKLVPLEVLYTEAPAPIEPAPVRSANSTISADLYCSGVKEPKPLTLTFRLANKDGQPVAGKRVSFTTLANEDFGFDETIQADKPTDQNGITTAQLKSRPDARGHASSIYATDVTDLVDIGQVAHVRFPDVQEGFFASPCTDGFDPNLITVEPLPMVVGRPLTLKVKLENRQKSEVELTATFQATDWNIGANTWKDVGHVDNIRLKPGESRDVSVTWTPTAEEVHQCFRVSLKARMLTSALPESPTAIPPLAASLSPQSLMKAAFQVAGGYEGAVGSVAAGASVQRNLADVLPPPPCTHVPSVEGGHTVESAINVDYVLTHPCTPSFDWKFEAAQAASRYRSVWLQDCRQAADGAMFGGPLKTAASRFMYFENACRMYDTLIKNADTMAHDPADPNYWTVTVAASDSPADYLDAWRRSWERYQGAQSAGDHSWMAKHATAIEFYAKNFASALRRYGEDVKKHASEVTPEDDLPVQQLSARSKQVDEWLRNGAPLNADQRRALQSVGIDAERFHNVMIALAAAPEKVALKPARDVLQEQAAAAAEVAAGFEKVDTSPTAPELSGQGNRPLVQSFNLSNPHDRTEDVRLTIEPMSIPSAWKLSVVNAEEVGPVAQASAPRGGSEAGASAPQPEFPLHEVQPGREYVVTLPAKRQIRVASVLVPVGEVGANTTARWAVEGRIGNEVIGTMVHEMNVAYIIPDMKLPAVGSQEQMEEGAPLPTNTGSRHIMAIAIAAAAAMVLVLFLFLLRRKRQQSAA